MLRVHSDVYQKTCSIDLAIKTRGVEHPVERAHHWLSVTDQLATGGKLTY